MRLTKNLRAAFVRDVINNIPTKDYKTEITDALIALAVTKLPAQVRAVWEDKALRPYIGLDYWYVREYSVAVKVPMGDTKIKIPPALATKLAALHAADINQTREITAARKKLQETADGCTTTQKLAELLPDLAQYIPVSERQACTNLPVAADVMPRLKALGFPKKAAKDSK